MTKKTDERVATDQKALRRLRGTDFAVCTFAKIARRLDTHQTNIARAYASGYKAEGVSPALLRAMAAKGYLDPHEVNEVLKVEVQPCGECGEAHTVPWCTDKEGAPVKAPYNRKGKTKRSKKRYRKIAELHSQEEMDMLDLAAAEIELDWSELVGWFAHLATTADGYNGDGLKRIARWLTMVVYDDPQDPEAQANYERLADVAEEE